MNYFRSRWLAAAATLLMVAAGCGSSSKSASTAGRTYKVGVLTDASGLAASVLGVGFPRGIKAGIGVAAKQGYTIDYVVGDTTSSPAGALAAAQKLVEQDHVFAVFMDSSFGFAAANYLKAHNIPVIGSAVDGPEWTQDSNMFSVTGYPDFGKVPSTVADFFKLEGVSDVASVGYGIAPSSRSSAEGVAIASRDAGMKIGYLNANFPFGSTDVGPLVLAMKDAGIDALNSVVLTSSTLAIISGLKQQGVTLKATALPTGYGADLVNGGQDAEQEAQGMDFYIGWEPVEMHTAATERFSDALRTYSDLNGDPTLNDYTGYLTVDAFVAGLKATGSNVTQSAFIRAMLDMTNYDVAGLDGNHRVSFAMQTRGREYGVDNCLYFVKYQGTEFHLIPGADPICGHIIPGASPAGAS